MFTHAITRKPCPDFGLGITTANLGAPDFTRMKALHNTYIAALQDVGLQVIELDELPAYPDAHFVEDVAIVTPDIAVIARSGAPARQGEESVMEPVLAQYRPIVRIEAPGTLDGGDVLMVDRHFLIGISERTNQAGAEQLGRILAHHGNTWTAVPVSAGLHFKSDVNHVGGNTLLVTEAFTGRPELSGYDQIVVDADETYAANVLWIDGNILMPRGFPKTKRKLIDLGANIIELDTSEAQKMDGGLTCMSIRF